MRVDRWMFIGCALIAAGCAGTRVAEDAPIPAPAADFAQLESGNLRVALVTIRGEGDPEALVGDPGWREFVLDIENRSKAPLVVENVKLLNTGGRYVDSAASYEQIIAPPDLGAELAGDVATRAAGIAAGQVIPYGGLITSIISSVASVSSAEAKSNAKRVFALRALKRVELAPGGKVTASAFLPSVTNAEALVIDVVQGGRVERLEIPLSSAGS
jgi:hypothetical protein